MNTETRTYTARSNHDIVYAWYITAPSNLDPSEIEKIQAALVDWHDEPTQKHIQEVLDNHDDYESEPRFLVQLLSQVRFDIETIHRDCSTQDFRAS